MPPKRLQPDDSPIDHIANIDETMQAFRDDHSPKALQVLREQLSRVAEISSDEEIARLSKEGSKDECIDALSVLLIADMGKKALEAE